MLLRQLKKKEGADDKSYENESDDEEAKPDDPSTPAKDPVTPAKDPSLDKGAFIGFRFDGTEIRSKGLQVETVK